MTMTASTFKPDALIRVPAAGDTFFRMWLVFLKPYHGLTDRQLDIAAALLYHRHILSSKISDPRLLDEAVMGDSVKRAILDECNINVGHFQVIMGELRRHKFILGNRINPRYIPIFDESRGSFSLMIYFQTGDV